MCVIWRTGCVEFDSPETPVWKMGSVLDLALSGAAFDRKVRSQELTPLVPRLSKALGRSPESWLAMQSNHDLWQAKQHVKLGKVGKVRLTAA